MFKPRHLLAAAVLLASVTAVADPAAGIEVLSVEDMGSHKTILTHATTAPQGAYVEAAISVNGNSHVTDAAPVCPNSGVAMVHTPSGFPTSVTLRGPNGEVLKLVDGVDFD